MCKWVEFFEQHREELNLDWIAGGEGGQRRIRVPACHRPGLALAGHPHGFIDSRLLVLGREETQFLRQIDGALRKERLAALLTKRTPAIVVARRLRPPSELICLCDALNLPLIRSSMPTSQLIGRMTLRLAEQFVPQTSRHGTLVEVFGVGILIEGEPSIGKSEAALGLIERGHRLVSDDHVKIRRQWPQGLKGYGNELTQHHMEIRGIGIINVAQLYGAVCVRSSKRVNLIVRLEWWNASTTYDRIGLDEKFYDILNVQIPVHILPVKPGRDVVLLLETIALNHRLKAMGRNPAEEFGEKWLSVMERAS
jgi:HPr kinase/phosphorylase